MNPGLAVPAGRQPAPNRPLAGPAGRLALKPWLLLAPLVVVLGACGWPRPSGSPGPSAVGSPAAASTAVLPTDAVQPTAPAAGDPGLPLPGDAVRVSVAELTVRLEPSAASRDMGSMGRNDLGLVNDFVQRDAAGDPWIYVTVISTSRPGLLPDLPEALPDPEYPLRGWIPTTDAVGFTIAPIAPRCPAVRDFENVGAMLGSERLACFGAASLEIEGFLSCAPCGGDEGVYEPAWLAGRAAGFLSDVDTGGGHRLALYVPPELTLPGSPADLRVRGHFGDPRSATCRMNPGDGPVALENAVELCRRRFVVESIEVL